MVGSTPTSSPAILEHLTKFVVKAPAPNASGPTITAPGLFSELQERIRAGLTDVSRLFLDGYSGRCNYRFSSDP
jgi:hypothetical protein